MKGSLRTLNTSVHIPEVLELLLPLLTEELLEPDVDGLVDLAVDVGEVAALVEEEALVCCDEVGVDSSPQDTASDTAIITRIRAATAASHGEPLKFSIFLIIGLTLPSC